MENIPFRLEYGAESPGYFRVGTIRREAGVLMARESGEQCGS
jgi:hypothetical protein